MEIKSGLRPVTLQASTALSFEFILVLFGFEFFEDNFTRFKNLSSLRFAIESPNDFDVVSNNSQFGL